MLEIIICTDNRTSLLLDKKPRVPLIKINKLFYSIDGMARGSKENNDEVVFDLILDRSLTFPSRIII